MWDSSREDKEYGISWTIYAFELWSNDHNELIPTNKYSLTHGAHIHHAACQVLKVNRTPHKVSDKTAST